MFNTHIHTTHSSSTIYTGNNMDHGISAKEIFVICILAACKNGCSLNSQQRATGRFVFHLIYSWTHSYRTALRITKRRPCMFQTSSSNTPDCTERLAIRLWWHTHYIQACEQRHTWNMKGCHRFNNEPTYTPTSRCLNACISEQLLLFLMLFILNSFIYLGGGISICV